MKPNVAWLLAGVLVVGRQPGMEPGMYVCSAGHLHIRGTVRNLAGVTVGQITLAGKAPDAPPAR